MSDVFDDVIDRQSPNDPARIAAVIAADQRFAFFGTSAFTVRLLRLDQKIASGVPMSLKRVANILGTDATLFQEFCDRFSRYGDKTLTLFAEGQAVEVSVFFETVPVKNPPDGGTSSGFSYGLDAALGASTASGF
jgi:hypothetical protein